MKESALSDLSYPMTLPSLLRRFLLPATLLVALVTVLTWEPASSPPNFRAQVTSSTTSSALSGTGSTTSSSSSSLSDPGLSSLSSALSSSQPAASSSVASSASPTSSVGIQSSAPVSSAGAQASDTPVIGLEAGLCAQVKPDPDTGQKLVYCCMDEGYVYQREASQEEYQAFLERLGELENMNARDAKAAFEAPYSGSIHQKYGWTTLCGRQIPCDVCSQDHICGNGIVEAAEKCDDGPRNSDETPDTCRLDCTLPSCGDRVIDRQKGEECDDGNFNGDLPNRCRSTCTLPLCGDRIIDSFYGETCDSGNENSDSAPNRCRSACKSPSCGDGVKDNNEECDDGNRGDGDGCSFLCYIEQRREPLDLTPLRCGNGVLEPGEECDTGAENANVPNRCRQNCYLPRCGDRIQDEGEECDDGNSARGDGCSPECSRELTLSLTNVCGNQIIDPGEECDAGRANTNIPDHCRFDCRFPTCGDYIKDTSEQCDDGNHSNGDGCTDSCFSEFCGNGTQEMGEACDDGNLVGGDGCSRTCQKEIGQAVEALTMSTQSAGTLRPAASSRGPLPVSSRSASAPLQQQTTSAPPSSSLPADVAVNVGQPEPLFVVSSSSAASQWSSTPFGAQVITFPTASVTSPSPVSPSSYYYTPQPSFAGSDALNDTGPAALSIVAMGAAAGFAWARRKRRD